VFCFILVQGRGGSGFVSFQGVLFRCKETNKNAYYCFIWIFLKLTSGYAFLSHMIMT